MKKLLKRLMLGFAKLFCVVDAIVGMILLLRAAVGEFGKAFQVVSIIFTAFTLAFFMGPPFEE